MSTAEIKINTMDMMSDNSVVFNILVLITILLNIYTVE